MLNSKLKVFILVNERYVLPPGQLLLSKILPYMVLNAIL